MYRLLYTQRLQFILCAEMQSRSQKGESYLCRYLVTNALCNAWKLNRTRHICIIGRFNSHLIGFWDVYGTVLPALYSFSYPPLLPSSLPSLSWQLFTTSETGETFSILKTLFKTLGAGRAGLSGPGSPLSAAQLPRKLSKLDNSHALHIDWLD